MKLLRYTVSKIDSCYKYQHAKFNSTCQAEWIKPQGQNIGISIYNCVAKKKVPLIINDNIATWYSCGPTVYDSAHIGHASCYVKIDIIQRILTDYFNVQLITAMGITDIDDKIINRGILSKTNPLDIARKYEEEFWKNIRELGISTPAIITRVTDNIPTIQDFIMELYKKNLCYKATDESVYFNTAEYGNYGKLQKSPVDEMNPVASHKKSSEDFALWKSVKPGEPYWEFELGNGRPGWHIECSAMVSRVFGKTVDFHSGGIDLRFPHHENEEAQSCAYHNNTQWVNYWVHAGHLNIKGQEKMSKSLKNALSIDDFLKTYSASSFRMACLLTHYQTPMVYSTELMELTTSIMVKLKSFMETCSNFMNQQETFGNVNESKLLDLLETTKISVNKALRDNFDTSHCMSLLIALITETNKMIVNQADSPEPTEDGFKPIVVGLVANYIKRTLGCFGLQLEKKNLEDTSNVSDIIDNLVKFRQVVRIQALDNKDKTLLSECDNIRNTMKNYKVVINDHPGTKMSSWIYTDK